MKTTTRERSSVNLLLQNTIRVPSSLCPSLRFSTQNHHRKTSSDCCNCRRDREEYGEDDSHRVMPFAYAMVFPPFCKASLYLTEQSNTQSIPQSKSQPEEANNSEQQMMPKNGTISRSPKGNKRGRSMITFSDIGKCQCCGVPSYCQECPHCHLKVRCPCFFCSL